MRSLWNDHDAAGYDGPLAQRVYTSRLLGGDPSLAVHGGGNTSVKTTEPDIFGNPVELLWVKGSGWDLASIEEGGFAPVRLQVLLQLAQLDELSDTEMARQLRAATVDPSAPMPSVEAILHALLPFRFVDHTHPDALLSIMNTPSGDNRIAELYGNEVAVVPYVMPGFRLAQRCCRDLPALLSETTVGIVLMHHGLFTFGDSARESYERTIAIVDRAEVYLREHGSWDEVSDSPASRAAPFRLPLVELRRSVSAAAGRPMILARSSAAAATRFAAREDLERVSQQGPATPDHVIRTKRVPLIGRDVAKYVEAYTEAFAAHAADRTLRMLDPAPRVILDPELGLLTAGASAAEAAVVEEIYLHTIEIVERAERLEEWRALPESDIFDVEYWDLEQAKLARAGARSPLAGEVAYVTGAASGIGKACVAALLESGAAVVGLDLSESVASVSADISYLGLVCDVVDEEAVLEALELGTRRYGGMDMLVLNAGIFPRSTPIGELTIDAWSRAMRVNVDANVALLRESLPLLRHSPSGGRVVINASRNVVAPGPGAAAYSASKAALTQLGRVAALEWGRDGIRVNVVHPDGVFDTGVWTDEVLAERSASYGLTVEEYRRRNVLGVEVTAGDVAQGIVALLGPAFSRTTGAQIPVDGGNERVI